MRKEAIDYIQDELNSINERLKEFLSFGYSPEIEPLVDAMCVYKQQLEKLKLKEGYV